MTKKRAKQGLKRGAITFAGIPGFTAEASLYRVEENV
jgi:hypothetical protein